MSSLKSSIIERVLNQVWAVGQKVDLKIQLSEKCRSVEVVGNLVGLMYELDEENNRILIYGTITTSFTNPTKDGTLQITVCDGIIVRDSHTIYFTIDYSDFIEKVSDKT